MTKPTVEQVKACWDNMADPTARKVADALTNAGTKISFCTVARYAKSGFQPIEKLAKLAKTSVDMAEQVNAKALERKTQIIEQSLKAAISGRIGELMARTAHDLQAEQRKALMAFNIALVEEAEKVLPILILNPKETGDLLRASAEVAEVMKETHTGDGDTPPGNGITIDMKANGHANGHTNGHIDPLAEALNSFRKAGAQAA